MNEQISSPQLRLIDADSNQVGIVSRDEALRLAQDAGLDLAEISPNADPPVAKILDWGKYRYEQTKNQQKSKSRQKQIDVKQIRLGLKTDKHDVLVKVKAADRFLKSGNKVKVNVRFRGREITHPEFGQQVLDNFYSQLEGQAEIETAPSMNGRELSMILVRRKDAKD